MNDTSEEEIFTKGYDTIDDDIITNGGVQQSRGLTATNAVRLGEHVALPLIIALGLTTNGICLKLLRSPVLKKTYIHKYITLLVCLDIVNFVFHIPKIFGHCPISNYGFAVYMTRVNWVIILFLRTLGIYILVFISYDRCLAIWFTNKFQDTVDRDPFKIRMAVLAIWCLISCIPAMSMGQVNEHDGSGGTEWISIPALKVNATTNWEEFYGVYSGTFFVGLPISAIVGLSLGLVLGIVLNKMKDFDQERRRTQILKTVAVLALNISFGFLFVPYSALLLHYDKPEDKCYKGASEETLLFGLYILILLWSAFNGLLYVLLNEAYMEEFKNMIRSSRLCKKCLGSDSSKNQPVTYFTFIDSSKANDDKIEENKENIIKEELPRDNYVKDEPDGTQNSSDITHYKSADDATNTEKKTQGKDSDNKEDQELSKENNNTSPDHTNEGFEPDKEELEKDNCIKATTSTVNYSTFSGPDTDDDRHLILHFKNDKKEPVEKDVLEDKQEDTKMPSNESPTHSSSDEIDPDMEIVDKEDCIRDSPELLIESSDISPDQSPNEILDSEKESLGKDNDIEGDEEETKLSDDISPTPSTSENFDPSIKRGSFHEYDVKKAKGTLEDASKLYKSTASINFGK